MNNDRSILFIHDLDERRRDLSQDQFAFRREIFTSNPKIMPMTFAKVRAGRSMSTGQNVTMDCLLLPTVIAYRIADPYAHVSLAYLSEMMPDADRLVWEVCSGLGVISAF